MSPESLEILRRYLAGEVDLEWAAHAIHGAGDYGIHHGPDVSAADRERLEALMGRLLWLSLRANDPDSVPPEPFGAAEFREFAQPDDVDPED